jgi:GDP-4-dehydro-6-deoxy-D-mannose reductase
VKALVTGSLGFVGHYLRGELEHNGYEVIGIDVREAENTICCDLLDMEQTEKAITPVHPDILIHLAGQADVGRSWRIPQKTVEINVLAAVNLMEAVRAVCPEARMVLVGSSDEYGQLGAAGQNVTEETPVKPMSPYAVSKLAQEQMAQVYARAYGLHICMTRSFNHCGAGQREGFLIPDFASGVARVEKGLQPAMKVGNLESRRDFTHVRDVVRAYRLIAEGGRPGEIYNVGSGMTHSAQEILDKLCAMALCPIPVERDPARMRPSDTPVICCNHDKLTKDTGWEPQIGLDVILAETLAEWRGKLS